MQFRVMQFPVLSEWQQHNAEVGQVIQLKAPRGRKGHCHHKRSAFGLYLPINNLQLKRLKVLPGEAHPTTAKKACTNPSVGL